MFESSRFKQPLLKNLHLILFFHTSFLCSKHDFSRPGERGGYALVIVWYFVILNTPLKTLGNVVPGVLNDL